MTNPLNQVLDIEIESLLEHVSHIARAYCRYAFLCKASWSISTPPGWAACLL